jgi:hypothetical protein
MYAEEATNPTKSVDLLPLAVQARSHSSTAAEEISQGQNSITACPLLNKTLGYEITWELA